MFDSDIGDVLEDEAEYLTISSQDTQVLMDTDKGEEMDKQKPPPGLDSD